MSASLRFHVRKQVTAMISNNELVATRTILSTICDAIVELDSDLMIAEEAPGLAALLLHGGGRSLKGTQLGTLLATEEDHERFLAHLRREVTGASLATVFHVQMRDSIGNRLSLESFHVRYVGLDAKCWHLIGLREHGDACQKGDAGLPGVASPIGEANNSYDSNDSAQSYESQQQQQAAAPDLVVFDPLTLEVLGAARNSEQLALGASRNSEQLASIDWFSKKVFTEFLPQSERQAFLKMFTDLSNEILNSYNGYPISVDVDVIFEVPTSTLSGTTKLHCRCRLLFQTKDDCKTTGIAVSLGDRHSDENQILVYAMIVAIDRS
ncbi:unnamed protein product, partial [Polarella glacialis]